MSPERRRDAAALAVEELSDLPALDALAPEWWKLWRGAASAATPFQSPAWLLAWWRAFAPGEIMTLAVRDRANGGALAGLAPLYVSGRTVRLIGVGVSDYLGLLYRDGDGSRVAAAVLEHIADRRSACWDVCDLFDLGPGEPLLDAPLPATAAMCRDERHESGEPCPVLRLPARLDDLGAHVPTRMLEKLRYYRRRLGREGDVRIERATRENLPRLMDTLLSLHGARWAERGEAGGVLADPRVRRLHDAAAPALLDADALRLSALSLDGRTIAVFYGFADRRRTYYYLGGFDPAFARFSPGAVIVGHAIEEAVREGAAEFHFLRGREPYKYAWGAEDRPSFRRVLSQGAAIDGE